MQPDELHCWYTDAHDAAEVASRAADTFKLLTTNASTVPATAGAAPANAAAASLIHATPLTAHTVAVEPALAGSLGANGTPPPAAAASHTAVTALTAAPAAVYTEARRQGDATALHVLVVLGSRLCYWFSCPSAQIVPLGHLRCRWPHFRSTCTSKV